MTLFGASISVVHSDLIHLQQQQQQQQQTNMATAGENENNDVHDTSNDSTTITITNTNNSIDDNIDITSLFINEWLGAIVDSILGYFLAGILQLNRINRSGAAQLCVDIDYLR